MAKIVKRSLIIFISTIGLLLLIFFLYLSISFIKFSNLSLNKDLLTNTSLNIEIFNIENEKIKENNSFNGSYVKLENLNDYTKNAFISIEDKTFYKHNGVNLKRIVKAILINIKNHSYKEGASTISQQLIKNTHLSGEKTIERKIKEICLTKKLEKEFSKDEILEYYLNIVYFGNNNYGLEKASNYYFSKESKDLSLSESALLAGLLCSPKNYSPILNPEKSINRRNLVLDEMAKDGKISYSDAIKAKNEKLILKINNSKENKLNSYSEQAIDESIKILRMPAKQIAIGGYKIYTYQSPTMQKNLENAFLDINHNCDTCGIILDNQSKSVSAFVGNSPYKILENKRQPGSLLKPIIAYAPAINENIISPSTMLLDEEINISGFSPKNANGTFSGYVSTREALSKSINIPAVKVLSYVGIEKAKSYAKKLGVEFSEDDASYALALGGMTYGVNIKQIANSYMCFANCGQFSDAKFVHFITDKNGKIIYKNEPKTSMVFREDTAFLINDMLKTSAQTGTAKKLQSLNKPIASKTGTVGIKNSKENLDAWNVSYDKNITSVIWFGNLDNTPISISGGNEPTEVNKNIFKNIQVEDFSKPTSVEEKEIDLIELEENHRVMFVNENTPERYKKSEYFSRFNSSNETSTLFLLPPNLEAYISSINEQKILNFTTLKYLKYDIYEDGILIKTYKDTSEKVEYPLNNGHDYIIEASYEATLLSTTKTFSIPNHNEKTFSIKKNKKWYI